MAKNIFKTGKQTRPKTAVKGKRFRCAACRKRSPKPVKTPAPWYCPNCLKVEPANEDATPSACACPVPRHLCSQGRLQG